MKHLSGQQSGRFTDEEQTEGRLRNSGAGRMDVELIRASARTVPGTILGYALQTSVVLPFMVLEGQMQNKLPRAAIKIVRLRNINSFIKNV